MRALIIEDDLTCSEHIKKSLLKSGILCDTCYYGSEGFEIAASSSYDIIITDINLPDTTGQQLIQKIRSLGNKEKNKVPILAISGISTIDSKLEAFVCGVDDYLVKPFDIKELVARIYSAVRRSMGHVSNIIKVGKHCEIDISAKEFRVNDQRVKLTSKEYALLEFLTIRKGSALTKRCILDQLYAGIETPTQKIVDVLVCKIRNKIGKHIKEQVLTTVWGTGYKVD